MVAADLAFGPVVHVMSVPWNSTGRKMSIYSPQTILNLSS